MRSRWHADCRCRVRGAARRAPGTTRRRGFCHRRARRVPVPSDAVRPEAAGAPAQGPSCSSRTSPTGGSSSGSTSADPDRAKSVPARVTPTGACSPTSLRGRMAEVARQARRMDAVRGRVTRTRPGEDTEAQRATRSNGAGSGGSDDAVLDSARPLWFSGPRPARVLPARVRGAARASRLIARRCLDAVPTRARSRQLPAWRRGSLALLPADEQPPAPKDVDPHRCVIPAQALDKGRFPLVVPRRSGASWRCTRSTGSLATDAGSAHDAWADMAPARAGARPQATAIVLVALQRSAPAVADRRMPVVSRTSMGGVARASHSARGACAAAACACVGRRGSARSTPMPEAQALGRRRGATGRHARLGDRAGAMTPRRLYGSLATEHHFYGFLAAGGARRARRAGERTALSMAPPALAAFGARARRAARRSSSPRSICVPKRSANGCQRRARTRRRWTLAVCRRVFARRNAPSTTARSTPRTVTQAPPRLPPALPDALPGGDRRTRRDNHDLDQACARSWPRPTGEPLRCRHRVQLPARVGLMQLMPATARWVARQTGRASRSGVDLLDRSGAQRAARQAYYLRFATFIDRLGRPARCSAAARV